MPRNHLKKSIQKSKSTEITILIRNGLYFLNNILFFFPDEKVLKCGLPIARSKPELFGEFWDELASVFEGFLFPDSIDSQKQEDKIADETVDCQLVELLREEILPFPSQVPTDFIRKIVVLLNKGNFLFI